LRNQGWKSSRLRNWSSTNGMARYRRIALNGCVDLYDCVTVRAHVLIRFYVSASSAWMTMKSRMKYVSWLVDMRSIKVASTNGYKRARTIALLADLRSVTFASLLEGCD
jgi:hypothetical protein